MKLTVKLLTAAALLAASASALAHLAHAEGGFISGLLHSMLGLDHLLAMAAIGFWSVRQSATLKISTPLSVIGGMILGAVIAWAGFSLPGVETGIALSVLLAGILIATMVKLPTVMGGGLVAAFMVFHGFAHGTEMPAGAALVAYLAGFSIATLALTFVGRGLGALLQRTDNRFGRVLGGVVAATGVVLAVG